MNWATILLSLFMLAYFNLSLSKIKDLQLSGKTKTFVSTALFVVALMVSPFLAWSTWPFVCFLAALLTWWIVTRDKDLILGQHFFYPERLFCLLSTLGLLYSPSFLLPFIWAFHPLLKAMWHHNSMPFQIIMATFVSMLCSLALGKQLTLSTWLFLILTINSSYYIIPGLAKVFLGKWPFEWVLKNRLYHILPGAWVWGWLGFVKQEKIAFFTKALRMFNTPLQFFVVIAELLPAFMLLDYHVTLVSLVGVILLQIGVFLVSGICFWEYILTNIGLLVLLSFLPLGVQNELFGWKSWLASLFFIGLDSYIPIWEAVSLSWWDSPHYSRIKLTVTGESGREYCLNHQFMCPYEVYFSETPFDFIVNKKSFLKSHIGHHTTYNLYRSLIDSQGDRTKIQAVKEKYGINHYNSEKIAFWKKALISYFAKLNDGERKNFLPKALSFLKAPYSHYYIWDQMEAYALQEQVKEINIYHVEKFFTGQEITTLQDQLIETFPIKKQ